MPRIINRIASQKSAAPLLVAHHREVITQPVGPTPGTLPSEAVAAYAYYIWEQEGRPVGREQEHWQQAELQLRWALLTHDDGITSQSRVRRTLWDQLTARFQPGRPATRRLPPAESRAR